MAGKQKDLPGMEDQDRRINELHETAEEYAEIRDKRMALTVKETQAQDKLHGLMKKHKRRDYVCGLVEVHIVATEEKVKVKIHTEKELAAKAKKAEPGPAAEKDSDKSDAKEE